MNFIVGADISDNNGQISWPLFKNNVNFVIMKAGEGSSYIDKWFGGNLHQARTLQLPLGIYHFARPDLGNQPEQEAAFFVNLIKGQGLQPGESLYLDFEKPLQSGNVAWALKWLQLVEEALGIKPLLYTYQSMLQIEDWTPVVQNGNALWIAAPTNDPKNNTFQTGAWTAGAVMQQWGNQTIPGAEGQIDSDVFFGTVAQFQAYGYQPHPVAQPTVPPTIQPTAPATPTPTPQPQQPTLATKFGMTVTKSKNFDVIISALGWDNAHAIQSTAGADVVNYIKQLQDRINTLVTLVPKTAALATSAPVTPPPAATLAHTVPPPPPAPTFQNGQTPVSSTPSSPGAAPVNATVSPRQQSALLTLWATAKGVLRVILW